MSTIKAGTVLIITEGSYSDYKIACMAKALVDIDPEKVAREFPLNNPRTTPGYFGIDKFVDWLANEAKMIEVLTPRELWFDQHTTFVSRSVLGESQFEWAKPTINYEENEWDEDV